MADGHGACDAAWFANAAGGDLVNGSSTVIERVETDSRRAGAGSLFVALAGERSNGHDFVSAAADSGAAAVLVSAQWWAGPGRAALSGGSCPVIVVSDTLGALQKAATAWRARFPSLLRFGVTGSAGKTSVKELLSAIVSVSRQTIKNPGNLNSDIGLSASIFLIRQEHEAAVFEMGINRPGEMDILASIYEPDCGLISNVGSAHIGVLGGSRAAIAEQKRRIASRFTGNQTLVVWEDDDYKDVLLHGIRGKTASYGPRSDDGFEGARDLGLDGWAIRYRGIESHLRLPGAHNLLNALAAIRAATLYGASAQDVATGLASIMPLSGRTSILRGAYTIVDDCYNANAESAIAAIAFCDSVTWPSRRIYVLGSMKELGDESPASHRRVGLAAARSRADILVFYGDEAHDAYDAAIGAGSDKDIGYFDEYAKLEASVSARVQPGDMILIKASRSLELERLVHRLGGTGVGNAS